MSDEITPWPSNLDWALTTLKPYTHQLFNATVMDDGPPRRRVRSMPVKQYACSVQLTDAQYQAICELPEVFSVVVPGEVTRTAVRFAKTNDDRQSPYHLSQTTTAGGRVTYEVHIHLRPVQKQLG